MKIIHTFTNPHHKKIDYDDNDDYDVLKWKLKKIIENKNN